MQMKDNKGVTLLELVIAIAILSSIILVIVTFYISGVKAFARETTTANNQFKVRRVSNEIGRELRRANTVTESSGVLNLTYSDGSLTRYRLDITSLKADYYIVGPTGTLIHDHTGELAKGIKQFHITVLTDTITVLIESLENTEGNTYKLETEITIRR